MIPALTADMTFEEAARAVLTYLHLHLPMSFWSVTRVENDRQTYLYLDENDYGLAAGGSHPWESSFCIHMASGAGPNVAPDAQAVPVYAAAGVNASARIGAYAGGAITEPDGTLFGAICGLDPDPHADDGRLAASASLLQLLGQLLSMVLAADRRRATLELTASLAELAAETDMLTGLLNRRAWERLLAEEESRFRRFGDPTVLAMLDLDQLKTINDTHGHAAGDEYIRRAAEALLTAVRCGDVVARLGGDEFGILMRGCDEVTAEERVAELYLAQETAGVSGSVGWAPITVLRGFPAALAEADSAMYAAKRERRAVRQQNA